MVRAFFFLLMLSMIGCNSFEFSPNQIFDDTSASNVNIDNLNRLLSKSKDDTVVIAFIGDSQRFYDEVQPFVNKVNARDDIDFVILAGDISDFGLLQELNWIHRDLKRLQVPYLAVVGNHDVIGNGEETFKRFFGPLNFSFIYNGYKFIFHNTNGREYRTANVPDLDWMANELQDAEADYLIGVSHVPPYDNDFKKELESDYRQLLSDRPNFILSLHGHQHKHTDGYPYQDGVRYMTSNYFEERTFVILKFVNGVVNKETLIF